MISNIKRWNKIFLLFLGMAFLINSCIIVKEKAVEDDFVPSVNLSPKPEIPMSETIIWSKKGDITSNIPESWFFVDLDNKISSDIIATAVNPDYSLSCIFTSIKKQDNLEQVFEKEGLLGLARLSLAKHDKKTAGSVKLIGKYQPVQMGNKNFVRYSFSNSGGALIAHAAVFASSIGEFYEVALIPMEITGKEVPTKEEVDKIFRSILTSIQY